MSPDDVVLDPACQTVANRAANEGIPVGAISRILQRPFPVIHTHLKIAHSTGAIGSFPRHDWPPAVPTDQRLPTTARTSNPEDVEFGCRQHFKLTPLETAFLVVLLRMQSADKEKLHSVIEQQRQSRQFRPDRQEATEIKMVDVIICKLRAKMKAVNPAFKITTIWGKGYYIEPPVKEAIYSTIGAPHGFDPPATTAA